MLPLSHGSADVFLLTGPTDITEVYNMNQFFKFRRKSKPRQEWNPHWTLKLLYGIWSAALAVVKIAACAAVTVFLILIVCGFVFVGLLGDFLQNDILPDAQYSFDSAGLAQTSKVYYVDREGDIQVLQQIHTTEDRQWAYFDEIPEDLIHAAVAIEDKRFYEHQGVDWITTVKACANMFFGGDDKFGGSTITQQLIKNDTGDNAVTVRRKVMEIFKAQQWEKSYDKDVVMEWYLNTIYLGRGCYGVKSAAAEYFGKELRMLTTAECASLISITNNPSIFNPYSQSVYPYGEDKEEMNGAQRNRVRQINVLKEMCNQGWITKEEYDEAVAQEIVFKDGIDFQDKWAVCKNESCGYGGTVSTYVHEGNGYYCPQCSNAVPIVEDASQEVYSYFVDTVLEDVGADLAALSNIDWNTLDSEAKANFMLKIQRGGYHIFSTLDMDVQNAVDAVYTDLSNIPNTRSQQQLQSGMVVVDNRSGDIVAMAGGVGKKTVHNGFNRATDAKLQTGSSQKPLSVYAPAFEVGAISPATVISDMPISYEGGVYPKNDNRQYSYSRTILSGITSSVNAVAVNTLDEIGFDYSFAFAKDKFGLSTLVEEYTTASGDVKSDLGFSPLAMGALTVGATIRDMTAAYATFANDGIYREARTYTKVYDSEGNLVLDNVQDSRQILSEKTVNYMNYCLNAAVNNGTGGEAYIGGQNVAGKTGTTSSNKDRWFCGFTGHYTAAVWCGYDHPEVIKLTGNVNNPSAYLWKRVMEPIHRGLPKLSLYDGSDFRAYSVCLDSGLLATDACRVDARETDRISTAYAYRGDGPSEYCDKHVMVDFCITGGGVATEYCSKFEDVKIAKRGLVRLTEDEIEEIKRAGKHGLYASFLEDRYVYYISNGGKDMDWYGFSGKANPKTKAPYVMCPVHTKEAWEEYEKSQQPEETEPTEPPEAP